MTDGDHGELRPLPQLRRARRIDVPGIVGRVLPAVAEIDNQVEPYASAWDRHNREAAEATGPLWVALGDSATQGIGATEWHRSWIMTVLDRLRQKTGEPWRLVNLAMSGGRFRDVSDTQVPVMKEFLPAADLVTCVIGSNDMMWRRGSDRVLADAIIVAESLPARTLLSRLGGPGRRPSEINQRFRKIAAERDLDLFQVWGWPSAKGALADDRIHPSDLGYRYMADCAWEALEKRF